MTTAETGRTGRSKVGTALLVGGYVVPLAVAVTLLVATGDTLIGVSLLVIEALVVTMTRLALRAPQPHDRPDRLPGEPVLGLPGDIPRSSSARGATLVGVGMVGVVLVIAVIAVIAAHSG